MRMQRLLLVFPLALAACGHDERPVVVNPPPASTVVVPPANSGEAPVIVTPRQ